MPLDLAARAAQIARMIAHAGARFTFDGNGGAIHFAADVAAWTPAVTDTDRNVGDDTSVVLKAARSAFEPVYPRQGQTFRDDDGRAYRIQAIRSQPPTIPTIEFICAVSTPS